MHHRLVTRLSISLSMMFALAVGVFAWLVNAPPTDRSSVSGARLFELHCAACHTVGEIQQSIDVAPDRPARMRELEAFLEDHGAATPGDDHAILDYLAETRAGTQSP
jgi:hypothetical protein